jgi:hypothetical protein
VYVTDNSKAVTWSPVVARDNSGDVDLTSNTQNGMDRNIDIYQVQYDARDGAGNLAQCFFSVKVSKVLGILLLRSRYNFSQQYQ